jgi:uncharacterized SAM-binding protein YcdF (DUF218 family)
MLNMKIKIALPVIVSFLVLVSVGFWKLGSPLELAWNYLVVNEKPVPSDVIIVLAGGVERTPFGVKLYQEGYAPKIIISGGESDFMEKQALALGVPEKDIIREVKSGTTFGNAYYSAEIMRSQGFHSAIVVTSAYHTRRSGIIFSEFFKDWKLTICAAPYDSSIPSTWWHHPETTYYVGTEYLKMVYLYLVEIPGRVISSLLFRIYNLSLNFLY